MSDGKIKILYLEDIPEVLEPWLSFIRKTWGEECQGARSRERAIQMIEGGFEPDLVIFDRGILYHEADEVDDVGAGDSLYYQLLNREIPIVVFSGDELEYEEPYFSNPPLGFFGKPVGEESLRHAVDRYREWLKERE